MTAPNTSSAWPFIASVGLGLVALLVLVAIPNFVRFSTRSYREAECKSSLKSLDLEVRAYALEHGRLPATAFEAGWSAERNRYVYLWSASGPLAPDSADAGVEAGGLEAGGDGRALRGELTMHLTADLGPHGACPDCWFTAACVANLDADPVLDIWSVSTRDRTIHDEPVNAHTPYQHSRDLAR